MGLLCLSSVLSVRAQEDKVFKHEVGVNFTPLIKLGLNSAFPFDYDISYRFVLNSKNAFRFKLRTEIEPEYGYVGPHHNLILRDTIGIKSGGISYSSKFYQKLQTFSLMFSYERQFNFKWSSLYIGIGVRPALVRNRTNVYRQEYLLDNEGLEGRKPWISVYENRFEYATFSIGASPYIGWRIPLTSRFLLNLQSNALFAYHFKQYRVDPSTRIFKASEAEIDLLPVLGEIGVYWKF